MVLIIGLILLGILLLVLEILILPGLIAGIIGTLFLIIALSWMYADYGVEAGNYTLLATFILTFAAIWGAFKSRAWSRFSLKETLDGKMNDISGLEVKEGDTGKTLSALRPSGTIQVGESRLEGYTNGEILAPGTAIRVIRLQAGKVLVEAI